MKTNVLSGKSPHLYMSAAVLKMRAAPAGRSYTDDGTSVDWRTPIRRGGHAGSGTTRCFVCQKLKRLTMFFNAGSTDQSETHKQNNERHNDEGQEMQRR